MSIITDLGINHRDYLKVSWRFVRSFRVLQIPATLTFILQVTNDFDDESQYYYQLLEENVILLLRDRNNIRALYDMVKVYNELYKRNTNVVPNTKYLTNKKENGVVIEVAFFMKSVDDKFGVIKNEFNPTPQQLTANEKSHTHSSKVQSKMTINRSSSSSPSAKVKKIISKRKPTKLFTKQRRRKKI